MRVFFGTGKRNRDERHGHGFNHAGEKRVGKKSFNLSAWGLGPFTTPHFNVEPNNLWVGAMFEKSRGGRWVREILSFCGVAIIMVPRLSALSPFGRCSIKGQIFEKLKVQMTYYEWDKVGC